MLTETEYYRNEEANAIGEIIAVCAKAIFDAYDAETMEQLQRAVYKETECGAAVSFELHETGPELDAFEAHIGDCEPRPSPYVYCGDRRAETITKPWLAICKIGVSSIVEGSDAEVPVQWLDLEQFCDDELFSGDLPELCDSAVKEFIRIVSEVNDEACALWNEANQDELL